MGSRGQLSPLNIIGFFVIVVMVATLMDPLMQMIDLASNATGISGTITETLLDLIPMFLVLAIVITLFAYARPYTQG
jgi:mannose/fructose/N-acetylgalactosamine-specific phosphotransferase system component IID